MDHNSKEEMPKFLKDLKRQDSGYRLPNDYFAKMQDSVLSQVVEKNSVKNIELLDNLKNWYQIFLKPQYALVGIATMVLIGIFIGTGGNSIGISNSFASLDDGDLEYFMENEMEDMHDQDIMATLSSDEMDFNDLSFAIVSDNALNSIPDDYIEDLENTTLIDFELKD